MPGEKTSATQPFPVLPKPLTPQSLTPEMAWGLTDEDRKWCQEMIRVKPRGFETLESGAVLMNDDTRKDVILAYQKRKQENA